MMGKMRGRKSTLLMALFVLLAFALAGCGSGSAPMDIAAFDEGRSPSKNTYDSGFDYPAEAPAPEAAAYDDDVEAEEEGAGNTGSLELREEKLVYSAYMSVETLEFEQSQSLLLELIAGQGGIIQSQNFYDDTSLTRYTSSNDYKRRNLTVVARVPSANYDAFINAVGSIGYIRNSNSSVDNISQRYYDTQTRLKSLEVQEERLLDMMSRSTTVEEMIQVEAALSNVQYEIDSYSTQIQYMDRDVAYSTVTVQLNEVHEYSNIPTHKLTFGERLADDLSGSWHFLLSTLEGVLTLVIYVLPFAVILVALFLLVRNWRNKRRGDKQD